MYKQNKMEITTEHFTKRSKFNQFVHVSVDLLIADMDESRISNTPHRIEACKKFWEKYNTDARWTDETGKRFLSKVMVQAPEVFVNADGTFFINDGGHRILAWKQMGYTTVPIEVTKASLKRLNNQKQ